MMHPKIVGADVYPPEGGSLRFDDGKRGVAKIKLQWNSLGAVDGVWVVFDDGLERVYRGMPFSYEFRKASKEKGLA